MWEKEYSEICSVAVRQLGLVTGGHLERLRIPTESVRALTGAGLLMELDWDVFQIAGSPTAPVHGFPYAAWLALTPAQYAWERTLDIVLSHASAARLHGLGAVSAPVITFTAPTDLPAPRATRVIVASVPADERTEAGGVPVTTAARTIRDLVAAGTDHNELRHAVTDAVRRDLIDLLELHRTISAAAAEQEISTDGPAFVGYLVAELPIAELSVRNQRAVAELVLPTEVEALAEALRRTFEQVPTESSSDILRDLAAEAIARTSHL